MTQTLLVLGAGSDIAQAIAQEFAAAGFDIILAARKSASLDTTRTDLEIRHQITAFHAEFDAADFASHNAFYRDLPVSPDVVLYSIGYLGDQKTAESNWSEAEKIITSNYTGGVSILSIAANDLEKRGTGTIIGISSVAGERGRQSIYIYGSAKSGFTTFLDGLRHRLARSNVNVITVKPGFVETKMTESIDMPKHLTAKPADLARAVFRAYKAKKHTLYFLPVFRLIMTIIRNIPEAIFVKTKL